MDSPSSDKGPVLGGSPECREALDRLYGFLDGELTEERRVEIQEHLRTCLPCLEAFDFEAELKHLIASRCRDDVPEALRLRVALALSEAEEVEVGGVRVTSIEATSVQAELRIAHERAAGRESEPPGGGSSGGRDAGY
jgi:mycothiol system anti-sigma-R factor